jgi:diaminopimelate decarboxylase
MKRIILLAAAALIGAGAGLAQTDPPTLDPADRVVSHSGLTHRQLLEYTDRHGSPLYVYDGDRIIDKYRRFETAYRDVYDRVKVFYALKANTNMSIVRLLQRAGAGAECISMGEINLALKVGYRGEEILFTSSSKSPDELQFAVDNGVIINLDSIPDLDNLIAVVERLKKKARISFRINTDVDPKTHKHISTSHKTTKFGILFENDQILEGYRRARDHALLEVWGIHSHIGSQIMEEKPFIRNVHLLTTAVRRLKQELDIELKFINLGGGLGIPYREGEAALEPAAVAAKVAAQLEDELADLGYAPELWLEPGRYLVADAGFLVARVNSVKNTPYKQFINVDTGFNHLVRPILYDAYHRVRLLGREGVLELFDVAGNICETGDILARDRWLPRPQAGDHLVFLDTGAYGFSMASDYNMFPLPAELLVRGERVDLIRSRETADQLLRNQVLPDDLK